MTLVPLMWGIWGALVLVTCGIYLYRARLTQDEDDQIFLDDSFGQEKTAQAAIAAKVGKIEPFLRVTLWLAAAATVFVICYYIWDFIVQFK